jgi:CDP-glucose 4,6-dehydratase
VEDVEVSASPDVAASTYWRDRPVFVTGATGLLGGWLVRRLLQGGAAVTALVRHDLSKNPLLSPEEVARVTVVRGDVRDQELLTRTLAAGGADTVFHAAAQAIVGKANIDPATTLDTNVRGTWTLLEAVRANPSVKSVVVASSDKAYGEHETLPYDESAALLPVHAYDTSKACGDMIARMYAVGFGLPVAVTRCGNYFGGGDLNWNRIVPSTIRSALRHERPVIRSDGTLVRDYFYIEDGVIATMRLAEALHDRAELRGEAFNFSYELPLDVLSIARRILERMGVSPELDVRGEAHHEIQRQWLTAAKARRMLGWTPEFTLDTGLDRSIAWYREYLARG